jgi:hypothetical protein
MRIPAGACQIAAECRLVTWIAHFNILFSDVNAYWRTYWEAYQAIPSYVQTFGCRPSWSFSVSLVV